VALLDRDFHPTGYVDPILPVVALATSKPLINVMPGRRLDANVVGALVYRVTVTDSGSRRPLILSAPNITLATLDSRYPKKAAFTFDTVAFAAEWEKKTANSLSAAETRQVVDLLRRGGKCPVTNGAIRFAAQMLDDHRWEIAAHIRVVPKDRQ